MLTNEQKSYYTVFNFIFKFFVENIGILKNDYHKNKIICAFQV